jgi:hypothetical protein
MLRLTAVLCVSFVACVPHLAQAQERRLPVLSQTLLAQANVPWQWRLRRGEEKALSWLKQE